MRIDLGNMVVVLVLTFSFIACNSKSSLKENSSQAATSQLVEASPSPHPCSTIENYVDREICFMSSSIDSLNKKLSSENLSEKEKAFVNSLLEETKVKLTNFKSLDENEKKIYSEIYLNAIKKNKEERAGQ